MSVDLAPIQAKTCVVRDTDKQRGRHISVKPGTTAARHLHYGRIILDAADAPISFSTGERETGFICLRGKAKINEYELSPYDALYLPRDSEVKVSGSCDVAEIAAPVSRRYPAQLVRFADVQKNSSLHFHTGGPSAERDVNIVIGKNVDAGRILAGVTFSRPGNWTSWPPHEHASMLEEAYLYIDMPAPGFGLQLVYTDTKEPEIATIVREGDCVLMPEGYHPNVAAPGGAINFLWMMAANREDVDRQFGVVNVQPEYASGPTGLEKGRAAR